MRNSRAPSFGSLSREEFTTILNRFLHPSSPIRQQELLRGRSKQLEQIEKALLSPGRNVLVYGERGVGKTSLAQTAALICQSSDCDPVIVACDSSTNFASVIQTIGSRLYHEAPITVKETSSHKVQANLKYL